MTTGDELERSLEITLALHDMTMGMGHGQTSKF